MGFALSIRCAASGSPWCFSVLTVHTRWDNKPGGLCPRRNEHGCRNCRYSRDRPVFIPRLSWSWHSSSHTPHPSGNFVCFSFWIVFLYFIQQSPTRAQSWQTERWSHTLLEKNPFPRYVNAEHLPGHRRLWAPAPQHRHCHMQPHVIGLSFLTVPTLLSLGRLITGVVFIPFRIMSNGSVLFPKILC